MVILKKEKIEGKVEIRMQNQYGGETSLQATILNELACTFIPSGCIFFSYIFMIVMV